MVGKISLVDAKSYQAEIKSNFCLKKKHRSKVQKNTLYNIEMLCKARNSVIGFFEDYSSMVSEAKLKTITGTWLKILTPKQMLQRLPIALAQVKAVSNWESLLNEVRKIVYSLYQSKEITKKVYNNIIKTIQ